MNSPEDTIAAIATPAGEGGLGIIRLSGARSRAILQAIFHPAQNIDLSLVPAQTCHFGTVITEHPIDQVVVTIFQAPKSYTGEDVVEIAAHGGHYVLNTILEACLRYGARLAGPGEFTQRAFLNGKMDLTQAEAVIDLIHARTEASQKAAMAQLQGQLATHLRQLKQELLPLLAHIEVGLDHSDEDHDFMARQQLVERCKGVSHTIQRLMDSARVGKILREGLRVAIIGRPNVGKSSLLNRLLHEERAIVTPIPGTTRDTLEEHMDWEGIPVILVDTAGIRADVHDPVEEQGIERTHQAIERADLILALFDGSASFTDEDRQIVSSCQGRSHVWVINKIDLPSHMELRDLTSLNGQAPLVRVSAQTGEGFAALVHAVKTFAISQGTSAPEERVAINVRHRNALARAQEALQQASQAAQQEKYEECVAMELKIALDALGEIIGETATEEVLDHIFSQFCVGK